MGAFVDRYLKVILLVLAYVLAICIVVLCVVMTNTTKSTNAAVADYEQAISVARHIRSAASRSFPTTIFDSENRVIFIDFAWYDATTDNDQLELYHECFPDWDYYAPDSPSVRQTLANKLASNPEERSAYKSTVENAKKILQPDWVIKDRIKPYLPATTD